MLLFKYVKKAGEDVCYRCAEKIETLGEFSTEHTKSWMMAENPKETFFNADDIQFSHLDCNVKAAHRPKKYHTEEERHEASKAIWKKSSRKAYTTEKRMERYHRNGELKRRDKPAQ